MCFSNPNYFFSSLIELNPNDSKFQDTINYDTPTTVPLNSFTNAINSEREEQNINGNVNTTLISQIGEQEPRENLTDIELQLHENINDDIKTPIRFNGIDQSIIDLETPLVPSNR